MNIEIPEETKADIIKIAEGLGPIQILEGLRDFIDREKYLLMKGKLNEETKAVVMHGLSVLTAVVAAYEQSVKEFSKKLEDATMSTESK